MPKKRRATRKLKDIKRQLQITGIELQRLKKTQRSYVMKMLKFGFATWLFGLSTFFLAIVVVNIELFGGPPPVWTSLLAVAPVAPVTITAVFVASKSAIKIKRIERIRRGLMVKYQKSALRHMESKIVREFEGLGEKEFLRRTGALKRRLGSTERELHHLKETQRSYVKKMVKFGLAAWIFGLSAFFFATVMTNIELFGGPLPIWTSLLVVVPAAPLTITAVFVRKFVAKVKRIERVRRGLLARQAAASRVA